jgi:ubiquinone/menaquinone biosynthesis C-methylase UbiE
MTSEYSTDFWLKEQEVSELPFATFWNDEEGEKSKEWYVLDGNFAKMEAFIQERGLIQQFNEALSFLKSTGKELKGTGIDLAAGNLWAAPQILNSPKVEKLYCLEYSKHRLLKIGKAVLSHYGVDANKVQLVLGSFYEIKLSDQSLDFVFMSQSFHHADQPQLLLSEIKRVLKKDGVVILIGEDYFDENVLRLKHTVKWAVAKLPEFLQQKVFSKTFQQTTLFASRNDLKIPDPEMGDHMYFQDEYEKLFKDAGFNIWSKRWGKDTVFFVLTQGDL